MKRLRPKRKSGVSATLLMYALFGYLAICPLLTMATFHDSKNSKLKEKRMSRWSKNEAEVFNLSEHSHAWSRSMRRKCYSFSYRARFNGFPIDGTAKHNSENPYSYVYVYVNPARPSEFGILGEKSPLAAHAAIWVLPTIGELVFFIFSSYFWLMEKGYRSPFYWLGRLFSIPARVFTYVGVALEPVPKTISHLYDRIRGRFLYEIFWVSGYRVKAYLPFGPKQACEWTAKIERDGKVISCLKLPLAVDPIDGPDTQDWWTLQDKIKIEVARFEEAERSRKGKRNPIWKLSYWSLSPGLLGEKRFWHTAIGRLLRSQR